MLHLLNGDAVLPSMRASGLPGECAVWGDVLWEGPLLPGVSRSDEIRARAAYFVDAGEDPAPLVAMQERWDQALAQAAEHNEVVIWLEHDLHDQFQLLHHLDYFTRQPHANLQLICIDAFPGVVPFHGLGQLDGGQLASLFPERKPVTADQLALGREAWAALRQPSPGPMAAFLNRETSALPFLAGAIRRFLEELPAPVTGLSRTETTILEELSRSPCTVGELFGRVQQREERVFMGDWSFVRILRGLSHGSHALARIGGSGDTEPWTAPVSIATSGRQALEGLADRIALVGIDRWLGGAHLDGKTVPWRWDRMAARLC